MASRGLDPLRLTSGFWTRDDVIQALRDRDVGALFRLIQKYTGASQTKIANAVGMTHTMVSAFINRKRHVTALDVYERIADGLEMPDTGRLTLGLAPAGLPTTGTTTHDGVRPAPATVAAEPPTVLARLITKFNLTYSEAARDLRISERHLGRIARGECNSATLQASTRRALEREFQRPIDELLSPYAPIVDAHPRNPELDTPASPLPFTARSESTALGSELESISDVLVRIQRLSRTVDQDVVALLRATVYEQISGYESLHHSELVPALVKQRLSLDALLNECSHPRQRDQLFEITAGVSGLLGYVAVGRGRCTLARAYCTEAFHLASLAQNANMQAWVRGLQSLCEYYAGQYQDALELAVDGLTYAGDGPQAVRLMINGVARARGKLADADGVHRAVEKAHDLLSRQDTPAGFPSSVTLGSYSAAQTASNAATAYVSLSMPSKAKHYIDLAMTDLDDSESPWTRSLITIDLAMSVIASRDADPAHASKLVLDALALSADRPIISLEQRAQEFVNSASIRWAKNRELQAVRETLSSLSDAK